MIPVDQTHFGEPRGNCWAAAIASVLEVPLSALPAYWLLPEERIKGQCHKAVQAYLARHHGCQVYSLRGELLPFLAVRDGLYHLISGPSPRGLLHSVVGLAGEVVHDPHPSRDGIGQPTEWEFLVPLPNPMTDAMRRWIEHQGECWCPVCAPHESEDDDGTV